MSTQERLLETGTLSYQREHAPVRSIWSKTARIFVINRKIGIFSQDSHGERSIREVRITLCTFS